MQTYTGQFGARFHHNADMTGGVEIQTPNGAVVVQFGDILGFVAEYVRRDRVGQIEDADDVTLLGLRRRAWDGPPTFVHPMGNPPPYK